VLRINACRLFLKVTLVSDISTTCGKRVNRSYYDGDISSRINRPTVKYPRQQLPEKESWAVWRKALQLIYLRADKHLLKTPLGDWLPAEHYHHQWQWNYGEEALFYQEAPDAPITSYISKRFGRRHAQFSKDGIEADATPFISFPVEAVSGTQFYQVPFKQIFPFQSPDYGHSPKTI
jgi:hypothetical protein